MKSRKPGPFKLVEFLIFGGIAIIMTVAALLVSFSGPIKDSSGGIITVPASLLMWAIALSVWIFYFVKVYLRYREEKLFKIETKHGLLVNPNGYNITKQELEENTELLYNRYAENTEIDAKKHLEKKVVWVTFYPNLIRERKGSSATYMGMANIGDRKIKVTYAKSKKEDIPAPNKPLKYTAFEHELGHIILGSALGTNNEKTHHEFNETHKLR